MTPTPKLYPMDTAPKDTLILGVYYGRHLTPIIWNPDAAAWSAAIQGACKVGEGDWDVYFENHTMASDEFYGWLPLPSI